MFILDGASSELACLSANYAKLSEEISEFPEFGFIVSEFERENRAHKLYHVSKVQVRYKFGHNETMSRSYVTVADQFCDMLDDDDCSCQNWYDYNYENSGKISKSKFYCDQYLL